MNTKITIITPVFNSVTLLKQTFDSIAKQSYKNIEYIVVDGGSTDGTIDLIEEYSGLVSYAISEKDDGMYDALAKGLRLASGEVVCYLNAGDMFYDKAIDAVVNIFEQSDIDWLTGFRSVCNSDDVIIRVELPFRYKPSLIKAGVYGNWLPYIQQESTFWRKELNQKVDFEKLRSLKFAGDYYLWYSFSKHVDLDVVRTPLGIFKKHEGQLSENITCYWDEISSFVTKKTIKNVFETLFEAVFWGLDAKVREKLVKNIWYFDVKNNSWVCDKKNK
jgi:glycosyltransferase involved in cell wall biosynthesis